VYLNGALESIIPFLNSNPLESQRRHHPKHFPRRTRVLKSQFLQAPEARYIVLRVPESILQKVHESLRKAVPRAFTQAAEPTAQRTERTSVCESSDEKLAQEASRNAATLVSSTKQQAQFR